jgi:hypothetical protein
MRKVLNTPVYLKISTHHEMDALKSSLEQVIDMRADTLFDEFPFNVSDIRALAAMPDDRMKEELRSMRKEATDNANGLEALQNLLLQLK